MYTHALTTHKHTLTTHTHTTRNRHRVTFEQCVLVNVTFETNLNNEKKFPLGGALTCVGVHFNGRSFLLLKHTHTHTHVRL
jgi:hypothetical protein